MVPIQLGVPWLIRTTGDRCGGSLGAKYQLSMLGMRHSYELKLKSGYRLSDEEPAQGFDDTG